MHLLMPPRRPRIMGQRCCCCCCCWRWNACSSGCMLYIRWGRHPVEEEEECRMVFSVGYAPGVLFPFKVFNEKTVKSSLTSNYTQKWKFASRMLMDISELLKLIFQFQNPFNFFFQIFFAANLSLQGLPLFTPYSCTQFISCRVQKSSIFSYQETKLFLEGAFKLQQDFLSITFS